LATLKDLADKCADESIWSLSDATLVDCVNTIQLATQTIAAVELRLIREIDARAVAIAQQAPSTPVWLREHQRMGIHAAKRKVELARAIDSRPALEGALVAGAVNVEQAAVVAAALRDLPAEVGTEVVDKAEAVLIDLAGQFEPGILRKCGERILAHVAPRTERLPDNGGQRPHVVVTVPFDPLHQQVGIGMLDTGGRLSPAQVRQLACDAQLIPAVLGGDSQVLDLGRSRRLITGPLRRALELRDRGCSFPGCDRPPRWCDGHHIRAWIDGGPTTLDNSALLCGFHHRIIHRGHWIVQLAANGLPEFLPPAYVDPQQRPRRNLYHHRT
jgi:hypothetical protein